MSLLAFFIYLIRGNLLNCIKFLSFFLHLSPLHSSHLCDTALLLHESKEHEAQGECSEHPHFCYVLLTVFEGSVIIRIWSRHDFQLQVSHVLQQSSVSSSHTLWRSSKHQLSFRKGEHVEVPY